MFDFSASDKDIKLIGEGGNSKTSLLDREINGHTSAIIKMPKTRDTSRIRELGGQVISDIRCKM